MDIRRVHRFALADGKPAQTIAHAMPARIFHEGLNFFRRNPIFRFLPGMYEVLDYQAQLVLKDSKGKTAVYTKRQHVHFLQNNVIAYQDQAWGDGNGHSHIRAAILGPSLCVPLIDGQLILGTWQQIVFIDFDNRSRERKINIQIIGEL